MSPTLLIAQTTPEDVLFVPIIVSVAYLISPWHLSLLTNNYN